MPPTSNLDPEAKQHAFITYFNALINDPEAQSPELGTGTNKKNKREVERFEELRDGRVIAEALWSIDPESFPPPTSHHLSPFRALKRIYHSIHQPSSSLPLSYLPCPDLLLIASSSSPSQGGVSRFPTATSTSSLSVSPGNDLALSRSRSSPTKGGGSGRRASAPEAKWEDELLLLCEQALLAQAVYGPRNELVIRKIRSGMGVGGQRVLKEVIEEVLGWIADEGGADAGDHDDTEDPVDVEADKFYALHNQRRLVSTDYDQMRLGEERLKDEVEALKNELEDAKILLLRQQPSNDSKPSSQEDDHLVGRSGGPGTGRQSTGAQAAVDKIRELEMDRLRAELSKRDEDMRQTEITLEETTQTLALCTQKIEELQAKADEASALRDELEVHKHASEKLRKSENVVEKLKKKLDDTADVRKELKSLEAQNTSLQEATAVWEEKYAELLKSKSMERSQMGTSAKGGDVQLQSAQADLAKSQAKWQETSVELEAAQARISQLEEELRIAGAEEDGEEDAETRAELKDRIKELEARLENGAAPSTADGEGSDPLSLDQKMRMLSWHEKNVVLTEQAKTLEKKLAAAKKLLREQEDLLAKARSAAPVPNDTFAEAESSYKNQIAALQKELAILKHELSNSTHRYRQEKVMMLKAWDDLSSRAMKTQETGQVSSSSWLAQQRANASPRARRTR